jgi:hypothetical protein
MVPATGERKKAGMAYQFKMDEFMKSQPAENVQYLATLQQTQGKFATFHMWTGLLTRTRL